MQTLAVGRAHSSVHAGNIQRSPTRGWERYYSSRQAPVASTFTATLFVDIRWDLTAQDRAMPCSKGMCTLPSTPPLRPPEAGTKHWSPRILKNTVTFFFCFIALQCLRIMIQGGYQFQLIYWNMKFVWWQTFKRHVMIKDSITNTRGSWPPHV